MLRDATCRLWDVRVDGGGPLCARVLDAAASELVRCDISTDGASACAVSTNGMLHVWDLASGKTTASIEAHAGCAYAARLAACGAAIATCGRDGALKVWDVALLQATKRWRRPSRPQTSDRPCSTCAGRRATCCSRAGRCWSKWQFAIPSFL